MGAAEFYWMMLAIRLLLKLLKEKDESEQDKILDEVVTSATTAVEKVPEGTDPKDIFAGIGKAINDILKKL